MAVGIRIKLPGVTQEQFDQVNGSSERVGLSRWRTAMIASFPPPAERR